MIVRPIGTFMGNNFNNLIVPQEYNRSIIISLQYFSFMQNEVQREHIFHTQ